jgi:hypothetical protein
LDRKEVVSVVRIQPSFLGKELWECSQSIEGEGKSRVEVSLFERREEVIFTSQEDKNASILKGEKKWYSLLKRIRCRPLSYLDRKEVVSVLIAIHRGRGEESRSECDHNPHKKRRVEVRVLTIHTGRGEEQSRSECDHNASFLEGEKRWYSPLGVAIHLFVL